ncbi:MAG TPA: HAD family hydrolase [Vicinamibacterales bacterium]|nr:HAD family hydrolase [Vicinamibacterales bacterium]
MFLDRDGVLNEHVLRNGRPLPPPDRDSLKIVAGAAAALDVLHDAGFFLVCVTNQPDIARGTQTRAVVESINAAVRAALPLDDFRMCPHDTADGCACRKPKPGMLLESAAAHNLDLTRSFMVGDRWSDIHAGRRAGCRTVLIGTGYGEPRDEAVADATVASIADAAAWIAALEVRKDRER